MNQPVDSFAKDDPKIEPQTSTLECVALATGMKCHPRNKLDQLKGCGLHDWHAEVLAIRAFNRFLVDECSDLAAGTLGEGSRWLQWQNAGREHAQIDHQGRSNVKQQQPFKLQDDVSIHMYCSEAPCGDASMELTMAKQADATPWAAASNGTSQPNTVMQGRGHFDQLGAVRRKPSRPDAPLTLSKSCTDKLALKQCTGLLSALTAQLVCPEDVYLDSLVLPESEYVPEACERAFGTVGRMAPLMDSDVQERWMEAGFGFKPFKVMTTGREFEYSRRSIASEKAGVGMEPLASNRSCVYTPRRSEVLINGVLEGRRWNDPLGASVVSRCNMWRSARALALTLGAPAISYLSQRCTYGLLKRSEMLSERKKVKDDVTQLALKGWLRNDGDEDWTLSEE